MRGTDIRSVHTARIAVASYNRVKNRNGAFPTRVDEDFELAVVCLCDKDHEPIEFDVDGVGNPVGKVKGNLLCWWGLLEWLIRKDNRKNPDEKLIVNQRVV
jgi:hypothetical protein